MDMRIPKAAIRVTMEVLLQLKTGGGVDVSL